MHHRFEFERIALKGFDEAKSRQVELIRKNKQPTSSQVVFAQNLSAAFIQYLGAVFVDYRQIAEGIPEVIL